MFLVVNLNYMIDYVLLVSERESKWVAQSVLWLGFGLDIRGIVVRLLTCKTDVLYLRLWGPVHRLPVVKWWDMQLATPPTVKCKIYKCVELHLHSPTRLHCVRRDTYMNNEWLLEQLSALRYDIFELFQVNKCTKILRLKFWLNRRFGNAINICQVLI